MLANSNSDSPARTLVLSYLGIRRSIGMLGLILPIVLGPGGWLLFGIEIQENMSSYYHTVLRDVFVGIMCAIGIFLYCYQGYDWAEYWTGKLACASAIGVALFPLDANSDPLRQSTLAGYLHSASGGMFFLTLSVYSLYHFPRTTLGVRVQSLDEKRDAIYRLSGIAIIGSMTAMGLYLLVIPASFKAILTGYNFLFWMEWVAVWAFSMAWLTKGHAILANIEGD